MEHPEREIVTLLPDYMIERGARFLFIGEADACSSCKFRSVCTGSLMEGRLYEVVSRAAKKRFPCEVHGVVVPARVKLAELEVALPVRLAREGEIVKYEPPRCREGECDLVDECRPSGLLAGDRIMVISVGGRIDCPREDRRLCRVRLLI